MHSVRRSTSSGIARQVGRSRDEVDGSRGHGGREGSIDRHGFVLLKLLRLRPIAW